MSTLYAVSPKVLRAFTVFMIPSVGERMRQLALVGSPKAHRKLVGALAHFSGFRSEFVISARPQLNFRDEVLRLANMRGLTSECDVLSENPVLDGRASDFSELFEKVSGAGFGTLAVIDAEQLAFFEGEEPHSTLILMRRTS